MEIREKKSFDWTRFKRLSIYYIVGLVIGSIAVYFFFGDRNNNPKVGLNGILLEELQKKTPYQDVNNECYFQCINANDSILDRWLENGDVKINISKPRREPFRVYAIDLKTQIEGDMRIWFEFRDTTYTIMKVEDLPSSSKNHLCKDCKILPIE